MTDSWLSALATLKPVLAACALPPVPLLLLALVGALRARMQRRFGATLVVLACAGLWLASCNGAAAWVEHALLAEPPALTAADRAALKAAAARGEPIAIVVLGAGLDRTAPEYDAPGLTGTALERLRYGVWLSRATGIPLAVSGGVGWARPQDFADGPRPPAEADAMGDIAAAEFGRPPRWRETASRDTRENAADTLALLAPQGVRQIVVVTNGWHMPRALREFRAAAAARASAGTPAPEIRAAPMGLAPSSDRPPLDWLPSGSGALRMHAVLHEALASMAS